MILIDEYKLAEAIWNLAEEAFCWQVLYNESGDNEKIAGFAVEGIGKEINKILAMGEKYESN